MKKIQDIQEPTGFPPREERFVAYIQQGSDGAFRYVDKALPEGRKSREQAMSEDPDAYGWLWSFIKAGENLQCAELEHMLTLPSEPVPTDEELDALAKEPR